VSGNPECLLVAWTVRNEGSVQVTIVPVYSQDSRMQVVWMWIHNHSTLHHNHSHVRFTSLMLLLGSSARILILPTKIEFQLELPSVHIVHVPCET
jgi:hypothetical protein